MKAYIIHDGKDRETGLIREELEKLLTVRGYTVNGINITESGLKRCLVCNYCGNKNPGVCARKDGGNDLVKGAAQCDLLVVISSISFGGYSAAGKLGFERTIPNVNPFFLIHQGELHHRIRYSPSPDFLMIGWHPENDPGEAVLFRRLAERNAVNFLSSGYGSAVFSGTPDLPAVRETLTSALHDIETVRRPRCPDLDPVRDSPLTGTSVKPWLIISCSGRKKSNSLAIAGYLKDVLGHQNISTADVDLARDGMIEGDMEDLVDKIKSSEGLFIISPLYHDTLSYPAVKLLEYLHSRKESLPGEIPVAALIHSGYPEPVHCRNALGILKIFTRTMDWNWKGGFSAGMTSPIGGKPLEEAGFITRKLRKSLNQGAAALAGKRELPEPVKPVMPPRLLCLMGNKMLKKEMAQKNIDYNARPFAEV
ncbi:MAG: hypothetical protein ACLFST_05005 [Spirochaetia bacterium]